MKRFVFKRQNSAVNAKKDFLDALNGLTNESEQSSNEHILRLACSFDRDDIVNKLINNYKIDINARDEKGESALSNSVDNNAIDCINILIEHEVDLKQSNKFGHSILINAVLSKNFNVLHKLLTLLQCEQKMLEELLQYVVVTRDSIALAILADYECIELTCVAGQLDHPNKEGVTALEYAMYRGFKEAVKKLILTGCKWIKNLKYTSLVYPYEHSDTLHYMLLVGYPMINSIFRDKLKWCYVDQSKQIHSSGVNIHQLLKFIKDIPLANHVTYLYCQNFEDKQVELLHYLNHFPFNRITIKNCNLDFIPKFNNIQYLCLNGCNIHSYDSLNQFKSLQSLSLVDTDLTNLPDEIRHLKTLTYLNVAFNKSLQTLPHWLHELPLTHLFINDNVLTELPGILPKTLTILKLHNNKLHQLNPLLSLLDKLVYITVYGNPLVFPDLSITKLHTKLLLQYLHEFLSDTTPNHTMKLSIIGRERTGKSALIQALISNSSIVDDSKNIEKTDGLEIHEINLTDDVRVKCFDLAGDLDYFESHAMFLSDQTLYLAVFDVRSYALYATQHEFLSRIEAWLSSIYSQTQNSQVILVGTHVDTEIATSTLLDNVWNNIYSVILQSRSNHIQHFSDDSLTSCLLCYNGSLHRTSTDGYAGYVVVPATDSVDGVLDLSDTVPTTSYSTSHNFPHIVGYYEVSNIKQIPKKIFSTKNLSINQLKTGVIQSCKDMLSLHPVIPRKWVYIQNLIKEKVESNFPIILYIVLLSEMITYGLNESDFQLFLLYYHSKGEILFYRNIDILKDYVIIDPLWLSNQLRVIITYKDIPQLHNGVLSHEYIKLLWQHNSAERQQILMLVFRQASLFIPFDTHSEIIPCRLPLGQPNHDQWPPNTHQNEVNYLFKCEFLPSSFFPHLMSVIANEFSTKNISKMKPVYLSNNIVYITNTDLIPCDIHTNLSNEINIGNCDYPSFINSKGLSLEQFLSSDDSESLFACHRNSITITTLDDDTFRAVDINNITPPILYHRVRYELLPHQNAIAISIRGPRPCCIAPQILDNIQRVRITYFVDITSYINILCPVCVCNTHPHPSRFIFSDVRNTPPICSIGHDLVSWDDVMTGKCIMATSLTVSNIMSTLTDYNSPKLFLMLPVNSHGESFKQFLTLTYFQEGFAVHLLCEANSGWHLLKSPGYRLNRPKAFVKRYGKRLQTLLNVIASLEVPLKIASGFVDPLSGFADSLSSLRGLTTQLDTFLTDFTEELSFNTHASYDDNMKYLQSSEGLQRREFCRFLNKIDEEQRFGDLIPTFIGDKVAWLCEQHHDLYKTT